MSKAEAIVFMKKRYKHAPQYSPARAENRHLNARVPGSDTPMWLLTAFSLLAQKEAANDLHFLSPQRAVQLFGDYRRGMMADVQRIFDQLEQYDDALFTSVRARQAALEAMPWSIVIDSEAVGDSPKRQQLAEAQKDCLGTLLGNVENFEEAYVHLGKADFAGVAALDLTGNDRRMRWEPMEPWCLARPSHALPWAWNAQAELNPPTLQDLDPDKVIIREAYSIDLVALFLICSKYHAEKAWDAFLDMFGNPSIFLEMPGATSQDQAAQYDALVRRLIGEGRGTIPQGAKFQTVETARDNSAAFQERAKWCREAIITIATGGTLTVTSEAGSGTLAGNAHEDSFDRLAAASALSITRAINRQFCRRKLQEKFPGAPILASFELAPEKPDDRAAQAQIIATLAGAGFKPSADTVSEMMGFEVQDAPAPNDPSSPFQGYAEAGEQSFRQATPAFIMNSSASESEPNISIRQSSIVNRTSPESSQLSEAELSALQALASGGLTADSLHAPGNALAAQLQDAVIANGCNKLDCDKHPHNRQEELEPWERRQEEREHLEALRDELDRQEEAARDAESSGDPSHYNEEASRDRWSKLSREGDPQTREDIEKRLAELDVEDKLDDIEPVEVTFTAEKKSGAEWATDAQQYFMEHYAGRTFAIGDTGHTLHVGSSKNRAKMATAGVNTQKRNESFKQLENVIARAVHISSEDAKTKAGQGHHKATIMAKTASFEKYGAPATINGEKSLIWFNAQTKEKGAKDVLFYEFGVTPLEKKKG